MRKRTLTCALTICFLGLFGCVDGPVGDPVKVFPVEMKFSSAEEMENRYHYEITGPDWETPHRTIDDKTWVAGFDPRVDGGVLEPAMNEPAPYRRGTPMRLEATFGLRDVDLEEAASLRVEASGKLKSTTDHDIEPIDFFEWERQLERTGTVAVGETREEARFGLAEWTTPELPERIDLWELEIAWTFTSLDAEGEPIDRSRVRSKHRIPTSWRDPIPEAPLYKEVVLWSARWAAGTHTDAGAGEETTLESEHRIAKALNRGVRTLGDKGYSYGSFPRPPKDQIEDRANVFLDFKRSACGEFRGMLMALIEFHGIDAYWIWFRFPDRDEGDTKNFARYKTREIAAVGREKKPWFNTNHIIVGVHDRVYDPTYTVEKNSWQEYEDWMFQQYCRRPEPMDDETSCIDNPAGLDEETLGLEVIIADNYK